jgi:hypothetical protein
MSPSHKNFTHRGGFFLSQSSQKEAGQIQINITFELLLIHQQKFKITLTMPGFMKITVDSQSWPLLVFD